MDRFEWFPPEILRHILSYMTDFVGIESLFLTSPWSRRVIEGQLCILRETFTSNPITSMPEIDKVVRQIVLISDPSIHYTSFEHYHNSCCSTVGHGEGLDYAAMAPDQVFDTFHTAARIQRLACLCLDSMRRKFTSAVASALGPPAGDRAAAPPSWIEEFRVYEALWQLEHYSRLRRAAAGRWGWSEDEMAETGRKYITSSNISRFSSEQIWTVAAVLADSGLAPVYETNAGIGGSTPECQEEPVLERWALPHETPIPCFETLDLPVYDQKHVWSPPPVPDEDSTVQDIWSQTPRHRLSLTVSLAMIRSHTRMVTWRSGFEQSSRDLRDMRPFRRLGVSIWDTWRMYSVGLWTNIRRDSERPTPDGGVAYGSAFQLSVYETSARWLALVGKPPPDEKYKDLNS